MSSVFRVGCEVRGKLDTIAQSYKLIAVTVTVKCYVSVMPYNCHIERITFFMSCYMLCCCYHVPNCHFCVFAETA